MKKYIVLVMLSITLINANIDTNIIKGHANTNVDVSSESDEESKTIVYGIPQPMKAEKREQKRKQEVRQVYKDYTNANILLLKQEMDQNGNNFNIRQNLKRNLIKKDMVDNYLASRANSAYNDKNGMIGKRTMEGECLVENDIYVTAATTIAKLSCRASDNKYINLIVSLVPNDKAYALSSKIISMIDDDRSVHEVVAEKSFMTHMNGSTDNIASEVNTHRVEKNWALFGEGLSDGLTHAGDMAVNQLKQSMTQEEIVVVNNGLTSQVLQNRNTQRPTKDDLEDYGVIGAATGIMRGVGNIMRDITRNDLSWSYKISKNSILNFNLTY